ncbi:MAG: cysteine synthase A [Phycisphaeraceae bacterium]|nr:cysteine synthase A [Phycisphaeraceae bacterium]
MPPTTSDWLPARGRILDQLADAVGGTPLIRLRRMSPKGGAEILLKMESENPLKSVKDRLGRALIEDGERRGTITPDTHIIEPTSGNTGIALAFLCAVKGYRLTLTMPESMSLERRAMLRQLGANLVLTPKEEGVTGAVNAAVRLVENPPDDAPTFMPQQFENPANPDIHEKTTGPEIWADTGGSIDAIVAGVGTGGTITGVTRFLRSKNPAFQSIAVEPADSPVISGGEPGPHMIMGIGPGFIPKNLDTSLLTGVERVTNDEAFETARELAHKEGILAGISTGANIIAAQRIAARPEFAGRRIVTIACSFGERYLSTALFEGAR